ncbi:hypothetical protein [Ralstonia sp. ASV6]|uniref:hypothetical protein n=1 Tax=Ralstonia sp. ASV6 TaxID=2795124 RepID=UPI0018EC779E|nr:hypothetical protein [Ralstonia sp. ASV6]
MSLPSPSSFVLDRIVNEQVWFRLTRPRFRTWLFVVGALTSAVAIVMVIAGLSLYHKNATDLRSLLLLAAGTLLFVFLASPVSRFVYVEQQRDNACERYRAMVGDAQDPAARTAGAVTCALQANDRLTAIALAIKDLDLALDGAKSYVDALDGRLQAEESAAPSFVRTCL